MTRHTAFWSEVLDLVLAYLLCGAASTPFLLLLRLSLGSVYFVPAAVLTAGAVVGLAFLLDFLEGRVRVFTRPAKLTFPAKSTLPPGAKMPRPDTF